MRGILVILFVFSQLAQAKDSLFRAHLGGGVWEGGDDLWEPFWRGGMIFQNGIILEYGAHGRRFVQIRQRDSILSLGRQWEVWGGKPFYGDFGFAYLRERTLIQDLESPLVEEDDQRNLGLHLGCQYRLPVGSWGFVAFSWDSYLFFPSMGAGILLATGRKQTILLSLGGSL